MNDPCKVLDVSRDASEDEIKAAYKRMARRWHPDRHISGKEKAAQNFIEGHDAYRRLMQKKRTGRHQEGSPIASQVKESGKASTAPSNPRNSTASAGVDASPSSRQSDLPATHANAQIEKHSPPSESSPNTPPNVSLNAELPSPSGSSSRSASRSPKTPSEPMIDDASPRTKTGDAHSTPPMSPEPLHQSILSPESDQGAPEAPDTTTPDSPKSPGHRFRSLLRKERKPSPDLDPVDDADYVHITHSKDIPAEPNGHVAKDKTVHEERSHEPALRPIRSLCSSNEWFFPLDLSLEELFHGTSLRFRIISRLLSREAKQSLVVIDIPPGTLAGKKICCPGVGHERKDGTFQDVVLVVQEKPHDRFERVKDDLFLDILVPSADQLAKDGGNISFKGIDGAKITVNIPYPVDQSWTEGKVVVKGAGMPFRKGRGELVVRWQVVLTSPATKWDSIKKVLHMQR